MIDLEWIRESNLIEGVDDPIEDARSLRAWNWFIEQPLDESSVLKLHRRIMRIKLGKEAGRFRTCNVQVGGRICPRWEDVQLLVGDWLDKWQDARDWHLIQSAHVAFEKIHPFVDGNGRTGRMIMNWQRVKAGIEPLMIRNELRGEYYNWFR